MTVKLFLIDKLSVFMFPVADATPLLCFLLPMPRNHVLIGHITTKDI